MTGEASTVRHGTTSAYNSNLCRCDDCRAAMADYQRSRYQRPCIRGCGNLAWHGPHSKRQGVCVSCRTEETRTAAHGTESRYRRCKCALCREAATSARRARRRRAAERA